MKQIFFIFIFLTQGIFASLVVGDNLPSITLNDQYKKSHTLTKKDKLLIMTFEKSTALAVTKYLNHQPASFLVKHKAKYITDVSSVPAFLFNTFALDKMQKFPFTVMLIQDNFGKKFHQKEEQITIYKLNNHKIKEILFVSPKDFFKVFE